MKIQMTDRIKLGRAKRWVIKIGSALITNEGKGLDTDAIKRWAEQMAELRSTGKELLLVSSGAVAEGMSRIGMTQRPRALYELQAVAALGQMGLIQHFESCFKLHHIHTAQVLLTHEDLSDRKRYLNARSTLKTLMKIGAIPIINENDTVATEEFRFGDNDTLAALVANLVEADALIILTDQQGLYNKDPRQNQDAELISEANATDPVIMSTTRCTFRRCHLDCLRQSRKCAAGNCQRYRAWHPAEPENREACCAQTMARRSSHR